MDRSLLVSGFMGTGKTTVGRLIAARCDRPFIDLDDRVAKRAGRSTAEILRDDGEPAFRELERRELEEVLSSKTGAVVAVGGGALLRRATRLEALDRAVVVTLDASVDEISSRCAGDGDRPLLETPDPTMAIERLLEERASAYDECHKRISTTDRSPDDVARAAIEVWRRDPIAVAAGSRSYSVEVGSGIFSARLPALLGSAPLAVVVTDRNVTEHYGREIDEAVDRSGARRATVVLEPGEEHKNARSLERIWDDCLAAGADRSSRLVGVGGGVVTDVAGFAAATWMRGISWVGVPTTLLAMVDASVGGKTAIDLRDAKNAVGAFWQPSAVICDVGHLATEPQRGYTSALAEVVKTALIGDPDLLRLVEREHEALAQRDSAIVAEVVRRSVRVKARVVGLDEREGGLRATLNLGHTVGHALEAHGGYGHLRHGEAVSLGLVAALRIGQKLGLTDGGLSDRVVHVLRLVGLPVDIHAQPLAQAVDLIGHDKKRSGNSLKFIVARDVGRVELHEISVAELRGLAVALAS